VASQADFVASIYQQAKALGMSDPMARLAASQAALESGYGAHAPGNNLFGIKAGNGYTGSSSILPTQETVNGNLTNTSGHFRSYATPADSLSDWYSMMQRNFPDSANATTFDDAVAGLNTGKYGSYATFKPTANDPMTYGQKVASVNSNYLPPIPPENVGVNSPSALYEINSVFPPKSADPSTALAYGEGSGGTPAVSAPAPGLNSILPQDAMYGVGRLTPGPRAVLPTDFATNTGTPFTMPESPSPLSAIGNGIESAFNATPAGHIAQAVSGQRVQGGLLSLFNKPDAMYGAGAAGGALSGTPIDSHIESMMAPVPSVSEAIAPSIIPQATQPGYIQTPSSIFGIPLPHFPVPTTVATLDDTIGSKYNAGTNALGTVVNQAQTAAPAVAQNVVSSILPQMLGTVAGRSALIDPMLAQAVEANRNAVAASQPNRGQPIMTNNNGEQVIGQRLNNSPRGRTVTSDPWYNSVTGL
jgi:hypothetical protein